jgi:hypothetical protein
MAKWRDAFKMLPNDTSNVVIELCWTTVFVGHYDPRRKTWHMGLDRKPIQGVTAWQPLPKPRGRVA